MISIFLLFSLSFAIEDTLVTYSDDGSIEFILNSVSKELIFFSIKVLFEIHSFLKNWGENEGNKVDNWEWKWKGNVNDECWIDSINSFLSQQIRSLK